MSLPAHTLALLALGIVGTVEVRLAEGADLGGLARHVAVTREPGGTLARVAGVGVPTHGAGCRRRASVNCQ